ncbi:maltokinase N-terminal cap-like domain-containing protein [Microbacterium karelineae]|uniref:maltokinase N-terminal cap-like domain-containing protein n=1 Tax=Microbacterium karelineae TaxID=2654283 RepID=UPI0012EAC10B|nr:phosphotransferase [Microbacterium karelineae]
MIALAPDAFESYLVRTRWFGGKGRPFRVMGARTIAELGPDDAAGGLKAVRVHLIDVAYDDAEGGEETYQVPLSYYDEPVARLEHALVGVLAGGSGRAYDAVHDRDAMALWLDAFAVATPSAPREVPGARFHRVAAAAVELDPDASSSPLTGEQSNSSVRFGEQSIMKVFRKVTPGGNPDIEILRALTEAGNGDVPDLIGWADAVSEGSVLQLAMLQAYLRGATDGFEMALSSVRTMLVDESASVAGYAREAAELARALARIHRHLREVFPSERRGPDAAVALAERMRERLDRAILAVPELDAHAPRLRGLFSRVGELPGLAVQRIHGDMHLGQALRTPQGWRIVDFEGEPAKPLAERLLPDSAWRDVAGVLRSFDYALAVVRMSPADGRDPVARGAEECDEWAASARDTFVSAYADEVGLGDGALPADEILLLDAYVADKAVYEAVYEQRNRPSWVGIPLAAIARLGHTGDTA